MPNYLENDINVFELEGEISVGGGGTTNYEELNNKPQINGVELKGNKTTEELGINIPTKTSDLNNDSGYVNSSIVANPYDETSTYAVGAYVTHENNLYKCNTAITTAEEWNAEHWTLVDVISAIPTKTSDLDNDSNFASIDDTSTANDKAWSAGKITSELSGKANSSDLNNYYNKTETDNKLANKADKSDTYTKAQTDSAIVGLIDDTTTANNKAWSSSKISDEIIAILPTGTASGSVASFNTSLTLPLVACKANITATQEAGTPTPSTPIAINGFSNVAIDCNGDTETLPLPQTIYGGFVEWEKSKLTETIVKKKFSDFYWYRGNMNNANTGRTYYLYFSSNPDYNSYVGGLCDSLNNNQQANWGSLNLYEYTISNYYFVVCLDDYADVASMLAVYGNVEFTVIRKNPNVIDLANLPEIASTISGANSFSADSGDIEVTYKKSIDDAIAELQALILS